MVGDVVVVFVVLWLTEVVVGVVLVEVQTLDPYKENLEEYASGSRHYQSIKLDFQE